MGTSGNGSGFKVLKNRLVMERIERELWGLCGSFRKSDIAEGLTESYE